MRLLRRVHVFCTLNACSPSSISLHTSIRTFTLFRTHLLCKYCFPSNQCLLHLLLEAEMKRRCIGGTLDDSPRGTPATYHAHTFVTTMCDHAVIRLATPNLAWLFLILTFHVASKAGVGVYSSSDLLVFTVYCL